MCTRVQRLLGTIRWQLQQLEDATSRPPSSSSSSVAAGAGGSSNEEEAEEEAKARLTQNLNAVFQELSLLERVTEENGGVKRDYYRK